MSEAIRDFCGKETILKNPQLKTNIVLTSIGILSHNQILKINILPVNIGMLSRNQVATLYEVSRFRLFSWQLFLGILPLSSASSPVKSRLGAEICWSGMYTHKDY